MSGDLHTASDTDMPPNVGKTANVLPGPAMLSSSVLDTDQPQIKLAPSPVVLNSDFLQKSSSKGDMVGALDVNVVSRNGALCITRRRSKSVGKSTKRACTEDMDGVKWLCPTEPASEKLAAGHREKGGGSGVGKVQNKTDRKRQLTISEEQVHVEGKCIKTSPEDFKMSLELTVTESTAPGDVDGDSDQAEEDTDRSTNTNSSRCSQRTEGVKRRTDVSQVKRCPYCAFVYCGPRDLAPHVRALHAAQFVNGSGTVGYKCLYCTEWNTRPRNLRKHMHIAHPQHFSAEDLQCTLKYSCKEEGCAQSFDRESKLRKHLISAHGHTARKAQRARSKVYDLGKMRERAERVEKGEEPTWGQCSAETRNKASSIHTDRHKSSRLRDCHEECWRNARDGLGFSCFYCNKTFTHHSMCVGHERTHEKKIKQTTHGNNGLRCEQCDEAFTSRDLLTEHRQTQHKPRAGDDNRCPRCEKGFASAHYVKLHVEVVHDKKAKYVCTDCGKSYLHKNGLNSHRENHHNPAPRPRGSKPARFKCTVCEVSLTSHCGMRAHMNKHNGIRPYACRYCERSFTSMNHRTAHENIHSGLKAHRCPLCYKVFTNVGTLYNHLYRYKVHGVVPRGSLSGHSSNVDTLLRAAELCQQPQPIPRKTPRPIRPKPSRKPVADVPQEGEQGLEPSTAPQGQLVHNEAATTAGSEELSVQHHELPSVSHSVMAAPDQSSVPQQHHELSSVSHSVMAAPDQSSVPQQHHELPSVSHGVMAAPDQSSVTQQHHELPSVSHGVMSAPDQSSVPQQHHELPSVSHGVMAAPDQSSVPQQHHELPSVSHGIMAAPDQSSVPQQHHELPSVSHGIMAAPDQSSVPQHHELPSVSHGIMAARDQSSVPQVDMGDTIWMTSQDIDNGETQVVIESEPAPAVVVPSADRQPDLLGAEQYVTLLQDGPQLADGQEVRIVTIEDNCPSSDGNITIASGQQVAFIIMPQQDDAAQTIGGLHEKVYIQIHVDPQCEGSAQGQPQWDLGQHAKSQQLAHVRIVDYEIPMDGVEYATEQTDFSTATSSSIHE